MGLASFELDFPVQDRFLFRFLALRLHARCARRVTIPFSSLSWLRRGKKSKIDHPQESLCWILMNVETGKLTQKRILSVRCPVCRAQPKEKCTFTTGHPSDKTHLDRGLAAAKAPHPKSLSHAALRSMMTMTSRGLHNLLHHK